MKKIITLCICCAALVSCSNSGKRSNNITLQQQWYVNSGFAGEAWAEKYISKNYNVNFKIIPGSSNITTTGVVMSNRADFGVAGAGQVILADENGADLVVVGVINDKSLAVFVSKADKDILTPKDFIGKRIGTMVGTPVDFVYRVLLKVNHINKNELKEVPTNWTYTGFIKNDYDVYPGFINDEPVTFARKGIKVSILDPDDYGVKFIGTVYFCRRELIENDPEKVQMFVNMMIDGWRNALNHPVKSIKLLKSMDSTIDFNKELKSLNVGANYYRGEDGKILYASKKDWEDMASQMNEAGLLKGKFDYTKIVDNSFVNWYYLHEKDK